MRGALLTWTLLALLCLLTLVNFTEGSRRRKNRIRNFEEVSNRTKATEDNAKREGRIFSLFSVVSFRNTACTSSVVGQNAVNRNGTCLTQSECSSSGGRSGVGACAAGFGVCCVFVISGAGTVTRNNTYIQNGGFPLFVTAAGTTTYTINRIQPDVAFLRLDFEVFSLSRGGVGEIACDDTFTVTTSSGQVIPEICGLNDGQHIYVELGADSNTGATLTFTLSNTVADRRWDIRVSQFDQSFAPMLRGCLQYHVGLTGRLETFNFGAVTTAVHLIEQRYSVCIRPEAGFCCVQYQVCEDGGEFTLDGQQAAANANKGFVDDSCFSLDFIGINGAQAMCVQNSVPPVGASNLFCGERLNVFDNSLENMAVCDCSPPFEIMVVTDSTNDIRPGRGVCLEYMQVACV